MNAGTDTGKVPEDGAYSISGGLLDYYIAVRRYNGNTEFNLLSSLYCDGTQDIENSGAYAGYSYFFRTLFLQASSWI